ncbi:MAG: hypothetical protein H6682_16020 [Candidatus Eisenbacteria bacterium]|nr:hypothetical protein [Candidatus Eisenbacteria bacterium]
MTAEWRSEMVGWLRATLESRRAELESLTRLLEQLETVENARVATSGSDDADATGADGPTERHGESEAIDASVRATMSTEAAPSEASSTEAASTDAAPPEASSTAAASTEAAPSEAASTAAASSAAASSFAAAVAPQSGATPNDGDVSAPPLSGKRNGHPVSVARTTLKERSADELLLVLGSGNQSVGFPWDRIDRVALTADAPLPAGSASRYSLATLLGVEAQADEGFAILFAHDGGTAVLTCERIGELLPMSAVGPEVERVLWPADLAWAAPPGWQPIDTAEPDALADAATPGEDDAPVGEAAPVAQRYDTHRAEVEELGEIAQDATGDAEVPEAESPSALEAAPETAPEPEAASALETDSTLETVPGPETSPEPRPETPPEARMDRSSVERVEWGGRRPGVLDWSGADTSNVDSEEADPSRVSEGRPSEAEDGAAEELSTSNVDVADEADVPAEAGVPQLGEETRGPAPEWVALADESGSTTQEPPAEVATQDEQVEQDDEQGEANGDPDEPVWDVETPSETDVTSPPPQATAGRRALVAVRYLPARISVSRVLRQMGWEVEEVADLERAAERLSPREFRVVFVDVSQPVPRSLQNALHREDLADVRWVGVGSRLRMVPDATPGQLKEAPRLYFPFGEEEARELVVSL